MLDDCACQASAHLPVYLRLAREALVGQAHGGSGEAQRRSKRSAGGTPVTGPICDRALNVARTAAVLLPRHAVCGSSASIGRFEGSLRGALSRLTHPPLRGALLGEA